MAGEILDMITSPVTVVTTNYKGTVNGMTVAWIAQVSLSPELVMVSIAPQRYTHELIQKSNVFAVNILADDQLDIGKRFGFASGRRTDKFAGINYGKKKTGSPLLEGVFGYLECTVESRHQAGDHTLFVGSVVDSALLAGKKPLVFRARDFF